MILAFALISPTPGRPRSAPRMESGGASYSASKFVMPEPFLPLTLLKTVTTGPLSSVAGEESTSPDVYTSSPASGTPTTSVNSSGENSSSRSLRSRTRFQSERTFSPRSAPSISISLTIAIPMAITAMSSTSAPQKPKNPASASPKKVPAFPPNSVPGKRPAKASTEARIIRIPEAISGSRVGRRNPA